MTYLQLSDPAEEVGSAYAIPGLPVTLFVSAKGVAVGEYLGALSSKGLVHCLNVLFGIQVHPRQSTPSGSLAGSHPSTATAWRKANRSVIPAT